MPRLVVSDGKTTRDIPVNDASHAVRTMAREMRKFSSDSSILSSLQLWADNGFRNKLRLRYRDDWISFEYRN